MNNVEGDSGAPTRAHRSQRQAKAVGQKKNRTSSTTQPKNAPGCPPSNTCGVTGTLVTRRVTGNGKEVKPEKGKRPGKAALSVTVCQKNQSAQRKLSNASSNASEDLSKDSGCMSGKLSPSDSSSEMSDCPSEGNKVSVNTQSDSEMSGSNGKGDACNTLSDMSGDNSYPSTGTSQDNVIIHSGGDGNSGCEGSLASLPTSLAFSDPTGELMGETHEDLVREVEDLRSENEYLKDEMEELRCEMLEMRDMFLEEEVHQLQDLRLQLDQANKMCRILQYRLRKAERRSIRVAQTGHVDGELVRTLEHDVKVAKNVSLRLHNELESVQKKNSQLEWENEGLRERLQDLEVTKQVLQAEMEKARENSLRRKTARSPTGRTEKKLSPQDDSADLKCQLHFAKEESALMCKKLTKLVSENESMREELAKYRSVYGDVDATCSSEGTANSPHTREAEVKVHLRLVEEEATLLSRRIVELEVENRGLRAEMSDMREKGGGEGGVEEDEEAKEVAREHLALMTPVGERDEGEQVLKVGYVQFEEEAVREGQGTAVFECSQVAIELQHGDIDQSQAERMFPVSRIPREGPVGGEQDPLDPLNSQENHADKEGGRVLSVKDQEALLTLRDHACLLSSAIQLLATPAKTGHSFLPSSPHIPRAEADHQEEPHTQGPLYGALELLQTMLQAFMGRVESLATPGWELGSVSGVCGILCEGETQNITVPTARQETGERLHTAEVKEREKEARQGLPSQRDHPHSCRDPVMRLTLQVLWVLHHWCLRKRSDLEGKETRDTTMSVLRGLLQELGAELQERNMDDHEQSEITEYPDHDMFGDGGQSETKRTYNTNGTRHKADIFGSNKKNWCYLSREAAQLDRGDPFKTWDHPVMAPSFPDLDLDQMTQERSHTAPEKTTIRIYYSPASAQRVHTARLKHSPTSTTTTDRHNVTAFSPRVTTPTRSVSPLCLRLSANLSDDMKEMTACLRQAVHPSSGERRTGRVSDGWMMDMVNSGTQTLQPLMVSVGLQTEGPHGVGVVVKSCSPRVLSSSLVNARTNHISTSLERVPGRTERPKTGSPKMYRRHSVSASSSSSSSSSSFSSSAAISFTSSSSASNANPAREHTLWSLSHCGPTGSTWARPTNTNTRTGPGPGLNHRTLNSDVNSTAGRNNNNMKPAIKPVGANNRYGLVTEFLRRVSGRADKPPPAGGQKVKSGGPKNLERVPSSRSPPAAAPLHRNDSVTKIVNQRFMKQREEASPRAQREEKGPGQNQAVRALNRDQSLSTMASEDGNYDCSSKSLTFCFARSSRSSQRHPSSQSKLPRNGHPSSAVSGSGDPDCEQRGRGAATH